jgi:hypothetical protein
VVNFILLRFMCLALAQVCKRACVGSNSQHSTDFYLAIAMAVVVVVVVVVVWTCSLDHLAYKFQQQHPSN